MISDASPDPIELKDVQPKEDKEGCGEEKEGVEKEGVEESLKTLQDGEEEGKVSTKGTTKGTAYIWYKYSPDSIWINPFLLHPLYT